MKGTVEDQERTDQSAAGAESGAVAMGGESSDPNCTGFGRI